MASLSTQDFTALVRNQVTAIQAKGAGLLDLTVGSVLRAVVEANAAVVLWLQGLILQLLVTTRAATSSGADLDTWVADFGLTRLGAVAASGLVTFSRFSASLQGVVPVGATVQTADGSQTYAVTLDTTNAAYSAALGGYVLAVSVTSVAVPVTAVTAGAAGNVLAGQVSVLTTPIPGVDTVSNAAAFTVGSDAESDTALRARFIAYLASLSKATKAAVIYSLTSLKSGVSCSIMENATYGGSIQMGYFYAVVDDGTGYPGSTFLATAASAVDAVRPITSVSAVFAPSVLTALVSMTLTTGSGYTHSSVVALVVAAVQSYINSLALGQALTYSRLAQVAYDASPGVTNVTALLLNGGTADVTATSQQVIKAGTITVA